MLFGNQERLAEGDGFMKEILNQVNHLIQVHETRNPFRIAAQEKIYIELEDYDMIKGFYINAFDKKFIYINRNLDEISRLIVCAHELGHAILHDANETAFLKEHTLFPVHSKTEREANYFAAVLILDDELDEDSYYKDGRQLDAKIFKKLIEIKNMYNYN